jgi:hypothetical protein
VVEVASIDHLEQVLEYNPVPPCRY